MKVYAIILNTGGQRYELRKVFADRDQAVVAAKETAAKEGVPYRPGYRHTVDGVSVLSVDYEA